MGVGHKVHSKSISQRVHGRKLGCDYTDHGVCMCVATYTTLPVLKHACIYAHTHTHTHTHNTRHANVKL